MEEVRAIRGRANEEQMAVRGQMREQHELVLVELVARHDACMADNHAEMQRTSGVLHFWGLRSFHSPRQSCTVRISWI